MRLLVCLTIVAFSACSMKPPAIEAVKLSSVRSAPDGVKEVPLVIKRSALSTALEASSGTQNLRLVPLLVRASQGDVPAEYRIFDIRPGSVGALLGLSNADILVSANDYIVRAPSQFYMYLQALKGEKSAQIEVRRAGKPLLLKYTFTEG